MGEVFRASKTISAQNQFTDWVSLATSKQNTFGLLISGLVNSTVTFQGSPDGGTTVYDIETFTAPDGNSLHVGTAPNTGWVFRAGVKTGAYGTDTIQVRLEA